MGNEEDGEVHPKTHVLALRNGPRIKLLSTNAKHDIAGMPIATHHGQPSSDGA